jgi:glycosyltransferase involved in cell wall biosynthesis
MSNINISVAMCTYNGGLYLAEQLESMLIQTTQPDELIVCDDGSTDQTLEILNKFANTSPFQVRIFKNNQQPLGSTKNFEKAINLCSGEIIVLSDQDDVWMPNKISMLKRAIDGGAGLVFSNATLVNANLEPLGYSLFDYLNLNNAEKKLINSGKLAQVLLKHNVITGATLAFSRRHLELIMPIPKSWVHDAWLGFLVACVENAQLIDSPLIAYRQHSNNQIGALKAGYYKRLINKLTYAGKLHSNAYFCMVDLVDTIKAKNIDINSELYLLIESRLYFTKDRLSSLNNFKLYPLIKQLVNGNYRKFANGFISFAVDLLVIFRNRYFRNI